MSGRALDKAINARGNYVSNKRVAKTAGICHKPIEPGACLERPRDQLELTRFRRIQRPLMLIIQKTKIAAMWLFLLPLIIILGTLDLLTDGRTRAWPFAQ